MKKSKRSRYILSIQKTEWQTLRKMIKDTHEFNYYPRGRVEIKNGKTRVFINTDFNIKDIRDLILETFDLKVYGDDVRFISDGSYHYKYSSDGYFIPVLSR